MPSIHSTDDIALACNALLDSGEIPTRRRIQSELRERAVRLGLPAAGAANQLIDKVIAEAMGARRAAKPVIDDLRVAAIDLPQALTDCMAQSVETVSRLYREGVLHATRESESIARRMLEAASADAFAHASALEAALAHSAQERAQLAEELDAAAASIGMLESRNRDLEGDVASSRASVAELEHTTRLQVARLEEDVRDAHTARAASELARHAAEASREAVALELANLKGAYDAVQLACVRAEDRAFALKRPEG